MKAKGLLFGMRIGHRREEAISIISMGRSAQVIDSAGRFVWTLPWICAVTGRYRSWLNMWVIYHFDGLASIMSGPLTHCRVCVLDLEGIIDPAKSHNCIMLIDALWVDKCKRHACFCVTGKQMKPHCGTVVSSKQRSGQHGADTQVWRTCLVWVCTEGWHGMLTHAPALTSNRTTAFELTSGGGGTGSSPRCDFTAGSWLRKCAFILERLTCHLKFG